MEFSVREWMIIIGVLLIVAVLLDGYRRVRSERRNRIRVTLTRQALGRLHQPSLPEEPSTDPNPELPNGGARVIPKQRRDDLHLDESVPVLMESVHIAPEPIEPESNTAATMPEPEEVFLSADEDPAEPEHAEAVDARIEPHFSDDIEEDEIEEPAPIAAAVEPEVERPALAPADDDIDADAAPRTYAAVQPRSFHEPAADQSRPNSSAQEVMIVNVLSRDKAGFKGQDVLQILLACDLRFGNMNIFHRYEKANGKGLVQFSVANLVEPGTFDLDRIESFTTPGLCFFLTLPGPEKSITAFNYMVETAQVLAKNLQGELRDEAHSVMTQQTIEHCRQRIRDFERKQLTLHL